MTIEFNGQRFSTLMGSDLQRDGMFLELHSEASSLLLMEAFCSDQDFSFTVTGFDHPVPLLVVEQFLAEARQRLPFARPQDESVSADPSNPEGRKDP
jgi:hypothetical protein